MKRQFAQVCWNLSKRCSSTEKFVEKLTAPLEEHANPLKLYNQSEKEIKIREKIMQIEHEKGFPPFFDMFMRSHTYLRISLTEKCSFRCLYCMPAEGVPLKPKEKMLSTDEILRLVQLFASHGIDKIRLTGGEPTIRKDLTSIVAGISATNGIKDVGITTNGLILKRLLPGLVSSGLTKVNISIDTLDKIKFAQMTRRDGFEKVWKSIESAMNYFPKVKLNVVVLRNQNDMEINDFIELTKNCNLDIRFIEFMPFGGNEFSNNRFVGYREMLSTIVDKYGTSVERLNDSPNDTTKAYKINGYHGQFGFITSMSDHFCNTCNRLRITADGNLKVCLHGNAEISLRDQIRNGASDAELSRVVQLAVNNKKARHADFRNGSASKHAKSSNDTNRRIKLKRVSAYLSSSFNNSHLFSLPKNNVTSIRHFSFSPNYYSSLTHVTSDGKACQVDVSKKPHSTRVAIAQGTVMLTHEVSQKIVENTFKKGDVLTVAKISSILGAKQVANLIPLCHPIRLDFVDTVFEHDVEKCSLRVTSTAKCHGNTGVEMEALTACTVAMLTVYDMCKAVTQQMVLTNIRLIHKSGGKTTYNFDNDNQI